jgi:hypothetical protein
MIYCLLLVGCAIALIIGKAIAFCYPNSSCYFKTTAGKSATTHRQNCTSW